jgi:ABC-type transporter Mla subunit MlaD
MSTTTQPALCSTIEKTPVLRTIVGFCSDIVLWCVLAGIIVGITSLCDVDSKQLNKHQSTVLLTLHDAYSLSKGSMVRLMGVPIGYVESVKLAPSNSVLVLLKLNPDIASLPVGAKGTVVAYGLGGSKSLDFELPSHPSKQAILGREVALSVSNPLRQKALLQAQIEVAKTLEAGARSLEASLSKFPILQQQGNIAKAQQDSEAMIQGQEQFINALLKFQHQLNWGTQNAKAFVESYKNSTDEMSELLAIYSPKLRQQLDSLDTLSSDNPIQQGKEARKNVGLLAQTLKQQALHFHAELHPLQQQLNQLQYKIQQYNTNLNSSSTAISPQPNTPLNLPQRVEQIRQQLQRQNPFNSSQVVVPAVLTPTPPDVVPSTVD